jgi:hypothetical protein
MNADLDAIRKRDARAFAPQPEDIIVVDAVADRHTLLAEVDRLNLLVAHIPSAAVYGERERIAAAVKQEEHAIRVTMGCEPDEYVGLPLSVVLDIVEDKL